MEKQFVPYELALKLKELGFDELCLGFYIKDKPKLRLGEGTNLVTRYERENVMEYPLFNTNFHYGMNKPYFSYLLTTAPLWQQVAQFLYINSNKQINFQINGSDNYEELCKKLEKSIQDFRNLQDSKP